MRKRILEKIFEYSFVRKTFDTNRQVENINMMKKSFTYLFSIYFSASSKT